MTSLFTGHIAKIFTFMTRKSHQPVLLRIPALTVAKPTKLHSPYQVAVFPVFNFIKCTNQERVEFSSIVDFISWSANLPQHEFRQQVKHVFVAMGYEVSPSSKNEFDLIVSRQGQTALVRVLNNADVSTNVSVPGVGKRECESLNAERLHHDYPAAILISVSKINPLSFPYTQNNRLFGVSSYDLFKMMQSQHHIQAQPCSISA